MKRFSFVCILSLFLVHETAAGSVWCKPLATSCIEAEKPDDSDVDKMCDGHAPTTDKGKCLVACMGEMYQIIVDNKLDKENLIQKVSLKYGDNEDTMKKVADVADACVDVYNEERCEAAFEIWDCVDKKASELGLNLLA